MQKIISALRGLLFRAIEIALVYWKRFRALVLWLQIVIGAIAAALIIGIFFLFGHKADDAVANTARTVTLRSVAELSGNANGESIIGSVRSRSEAEILAEAGGTVRRVNTTIGAAVPAGFSIAELENDSERASVLQAEGAYDAAVAAKNAVSPDDAATTARNAYREAFSTLDTAVDTYVDAFFGAQTPFGPSVQLDHTLTDRNQLSRERVAITTALNAWRSHLDNTDATNPAALLDEAEPIARQVQTLLEELARSATEAGSGASTDQLASLAEARANVNGVLASLSGARTAWRSASTGTTASVDASVKSALGTLRYAQANLERTIVRAPIAGTVNFLPIRVGDYVTSFTHVATVAQNGALEIVAYVSEGTRANLAVGQTVGIEDSASGIITSIAPALDPVTKQIEVRIAVQGTTNLLNGQSVRIQLPGSILPNPVETAGPVMLPLTAVKLASDSRVVFTVGSDGRLIGVPVTIGDVRGERISITSALPSETRIVTDARGLSEGQQVNVATP